MIVWLWECVAAGTSRAYHFIYTSIAGGVYSAHRTGSYVLGGCLVPACSDVFPDELNSFEKLLEIDDEAIFTVSLSPAPVSLAQCLEFGHEATPALVKEAGKRDRR